MRPDQTDPVWRDYGMRALEASAPWQQAFDDDRALIRFA
jgi:hypothetical protein